MGKNAPIHMATNTSVGQCTPSTKREKATSGTQDININNVRFRDFVLALPKHKTMAVAYAVTASV